MNKKKVLMKRYVILLLLLYTFHALACQHQLHLQEALDKHLVKAAAKSTGGFQGFCIRVELKNLGKDSLVILVEPGRRLNSLNDASQDILITKQELIFLHPFEQKSFPVKGYCCQATHHAPGVGEAYGINKLADTNLVLLALYLNANRNEPGVEQQAIWAVSDHFSTSYITSAKDTATNALQRLVCRLKVETPPWYSLISKVIVYQSGNMETVPVWLRGTLNYDCDKESYTTLHVLNEKGEEVCKIIQQWVLKGIGQKYELNLPVNVLVRGRYVVELKTSERILASREFEI